MSLANQRPRTNTPPQTVDYIRGRVVFKNNSSSKTAMKRFGAVRFRRNVSSNSRVVVYFARLGGRTTCLPARRRYSCHVCFRGGCWKVVCKTVRTVLRLKGFFISVKCGKHRHGILVVNGLPSVKDSQFVGVLSPVDHS